MRHVEVHKYSSKSSSIYTFIAIPFRIKTWHQQKLQIIMNATNKKKNRKYPKDKLQIHIRKKKVSIDIDILLPNKENDRANYH